MAKGLFSPFFNFKMTLLKAGVFLLTLGVTLPVWAEAGLKGIELSGSGVETRIVLKTATEIPYHIVTQSANKIVIHLHISDASQSIQTDFTGADNIDQLVLKPIEHNKLRLVIRGESLGSPVVSAVLPEGSYTGNPQKVVFESDSSPTTKSSKEAVQGYAMTALSLPKQEHVLLAQPIGGTSTQPAPANSVSDPLSAHDSLDPDAAPIPSDTQQADRGSIVPPQQVEETNPSEEEPATWQDQASFNLEHWLGFHHISFSLIIKISAFCGVLLIALAIILRRILGEQNDDLSGARGLKPGGFAFWQGGRSKTRRSRSKKPVFDKSRSSEQKHSSAYERPLGLKGIASVPGEELYENRSELPAVNPRQALKQYSLNANAPSQQYSPRESQEIDRELKRSLQMRDAIQQTHTKQPQAKTQPNRPATKPTRPSAPQKQHIPNKQGAAGLPANNTQVLDFLRNVADLMEKDGNPQMANNVKRGMNQRTK